MCIRDRLYEDGKLMELSLHPLEHASILGNIYIGKVRNIVKNIQAAFVEIENGMLCYLPLEDAQAPVYTKPKKEGQPLVQGDELLVQVSREAVKTKQPSVTTKISMNGKYLVFTIGNGKLGCSGKMCIRDRCTELVIAAKNPDPEEIKYEMSDFLYHAMVLMVERGVTWEDITEELANR